MELKGRLKLIASKVPECDIACDIGTDHAYIPVYLLLNKVCKRVIAADVKSGPLKAAEKSIVEYKLKDFAELTLGDGLDPVKTGECDCIIIAGMGGMLIKEILERGFEKARLADILVLQPQNSNEVLREWLYKNRFDIIDEELIDEGEKVYDVMVAKWSGEIKDLETMYYYIGERLIKKKDPLLGRYIKKVIKRIDKVICGLRSKDENNKLEYTLKLRNDIYKILEELDTGEGYEH